MQLECLSEDTSSQLLEREKFEELYFESLAKAKGLVMAFRNDNDEPEAKPSHSSECIDSIKFPEIALPSFSGDFREWLEFRETFDALINQSSLKSIQKFKYLRSCLKDGALEVVNSIEYTSDGYQMAWRLLCERYNNPRLLVSNHLRSLFEIPSISSENAKSLRALIDNINKHLRSLHTLNIPIDDWDLIIIYFMSNKLPSSLQRSWEENQSSNVLPSLQDFKNFIRRRADILDNLNVTKPGGPEARKSLVTTSSKPIVNPSCPQCKDAARSSAELPVAAAAAAAIEEQFYADDLLLSGDDEHRITQVALEVDRVLRTANFHLRKWKTNSSQIQQALPTQTESTTSQSVQLGQPGDSLHKILGLQWSNQNDNLNYSINLQPIPNNVTKRVILSRVSSIFDPLGLLGPCLILAKCFIQRLWVDGSDWDQPISQTLLKDWLTFYNGLQYLRLLQIPRVVTISNYITFQLHGFADSSTQAYGAAIYVLTTNAQGQTLVRLLFSKTRVAPLKTQTIPRLELSAALLLAVNMKDLQSSLKVPINDIQYWSDSTITLAWIKTEPHKLNTFVANRVTKIQALTDKSKWRWVPSNENPADLLSRGVLPDKLVNCTTTSKFWFEGPTFLSKPQGEWPQNKQQTQELIELKAKHSPCKTLCNTTQNRANDNTFINNLISRWSSDTKLFRIFALVLRFLHNCKNKTHKITGPISCQEQRQAANKLIIFTQIESFPNEYKLLKNNSQLPKTSKLLSLKPFMDNDLIRVGGRLSQSHYEFDKKHPIILHSNHTLTKLIMRNEHVRLMHAGPQLLLSSMKEQYWPIKGKLLANNIFRECVPCFRAKPHTPTPIMGDLPGHRVQPAPPFYTVALDYAGPFLLKDRQGRGCKTYKSYIAIFICSSTKAVHIELVTGLETHSFLSAFRRFIARRGKPRVVVSDNGTTFRGADRELRELYDFLNTNSNELTTSCTEQGIEWKFVPSYSPHMNGLAEGAVKSCKYHLKRVLKQSLLTYEGFSTILIQIEGILNSRPLCPIPFSDSEIFQVLTPAHFLIGRTPVALPDYQYDEVPTNRLKYFQQLQQIYQSFWKGFLFFLRDYVGLLQQRGKWQSSKGPTLAAGSVVLIKDKHTPPCQWRLARIIETHPGGDGVTRVATLRTSQGSNIKLSFPRICPLPILDNN
ncbi:uncharacterized protein LOC114358595 isoform X4 [Ostrinia furnacalis]|uniref:uncharacterized protein LOC114358595 isoform X4 n=1 Tax=Ostrinia furnacalis TaxID=93504 RepID=UPI00103B79B2|nr:uncharacterized protein LOC114358595 isoform X4 [Ostrinia furnacalis]